MYKWLFTSFLLVFWMNAAFGADSAAANITARMAKLFPDEEVTSITEAPIAGLYEVMLGASLFYMSGDGRYVMHGDIIDVEAKDNVSKRRRASARKAVFAELDRSELIEFLPAKGEPHAMLYVYTDIDCGYCRKMHSEVATLNDAGIGVSYLAFPRSGLRGESFDKATAVWCSKDRQQALTRAKAGESVSAAKCDNPVKRQFELGQAMGVTGTPAVYTASGDQLGGYVPASDLIKLLR